MTTQSRTQTLSHGWLDSLAVGMSFICAVHCMITPILVAVLPILASTFWMHKDFHLWMLLAVVPLAAVSLVLGCRRHKSRTVMVLGILGLAILSAVAGYESFFQAMHVAADHAHCAHCAEESTAGLLGNPLVLSNMLGAALLSAAHIRNYQLCRKASCCHGDRCEA